MSFRESSNSQYSSSSWVNSKNISLSEKSDDESVEYVSNHADYGTNQLKGCLSSESVLEGDNKSEESCKTEEPSISVSCLYHESVIYLQIGNLQVLSDKFCFAFNRLSKKKQLTIPFKMIKWCNVRKNLRMFVVKTLDEKKFTFSSVSSCNTLDIVVQDVMSQFRSNYQLHKTKSVCGDLGKSCELVYRADFDSLDRLSPNPFDNQVNTSTTENYQSSTDLDSDDKPSDHFCDCTDLKTSIISKEINANIEAIYDAIFNGNSSVNMEFNEKYQITDYKEEELDTSNELFETVPYTYNIKSEVSMVSRIIACSVKRIIWKTNVKGAHHKVLVQCITMNPTVETQIMYCITAKGPEHTFVKASFSSVCNMAFSGKYISGIAANQTKVMSTKLFEILESHLVKSGVTSSALPVYDTSRHGNAGTCTIRSNISPSGENQQMLKQVEVLEKLCANLKRSRNRDRMIYSALFVVLFSILFYLVQF